MNKCKKIISILLILTLAVTGPAFTPEGKNVSAATVSDAIPEGYTPIRNIGDLNAIRNNMSGKYILMNDIDLSGTAPGGDFDTGNGWIPIGGEYNAKKEYFVGTLDGNGHYIKNMNIYGEVMYAGLFGLCNGAIIKNLGMVDVNIQDINGWDAGAICGLADGGTQISNCFVTGTITGSARIGGIAGSLNNIKNCYSAASITSDEGCGGLTESGLGVHAICLYNCGSVNNGEGGAICGDNSERGRDSAYCYYLKGTGIGTGTKFDNYDTPLTDAQMRMESFFTGFDFDNVWFIDPYSSYPYPQLKACPQSRIDSIELTPPQKLIYNPGDELNLGGASLKLIYEDGLNQEILLTEDMLGAYDMTKLGTQKIEVEKNGKTAFFYITIEEVKIPVSQVTLNQTELVLKKGASETLSASVLPDNATDKSVQWSVESGNDCITLDNMGKVTAKKGGTAIVRATAGNGKYAECTVKVDVPCISFQLTNSEIALGKNESVSIKDTVGYNMSPTDCTDSVTWTSSNESILSVDEEGNMTGYALGTVTITGTTTNGVSAVCTVTVKRNINEFAVSGIVDKDYTGSEIKQQIILTDGKITLSENTDYVVSYQSNIDVGTARMIITGIKSYAGQIIKEFQILPTGIENIEVSEVKLDNTELELKWGGSASLTATVLPASATDKNITWSIVSGNKYVTVDNQGNVRATGIGTAVVRATADNGKFAQCTVTVAKRTQELTGTKTYKKVYGDAGFNLDTKITAGDGELTYTSSNLKTVTISSSGRVSIRGAGTAEITVSATETDDYLGCDYVVVIEVAKAEQRIKGTASYEKEVTDPNFKLDAELVEGDGNLSYATSDASVATVSENGMVAVKSAGETTITVTASETDCYKQAEFQTEIHVLQAGIENIEVTEVKLDNTELELEWGGSASLTATVLPENATDKDITWSIVSGNKYVMVDNQGNVRATGIGTAVVHATAGNGKFAQCTVTVAKAEQRIKGTTSYEKKVTDPNFKLDAELVEGDGNLSYATSDASVATVSENGMVAVKSTGETTITVTASETDCYKQAEFQTKIFVTKEEGNTNLPKCNHVYQKIVNPADTKNNGSIEEKCRKCGNKKEATIIYAIQTITLPKTSFTYNGKVQNASIIVKNQKGNVLKNNIDYTVSYSKNMKDVGHYTMTIKFNGNYTGSVTKTLEIVPKGTSISKLKLNNKGLSVQWKKQTKQTTGYEMSYSTNSKFAKKYTKTALIKRNKTTKISIPKLKANKKYYVRIRTYQTIKIAGKSVKIFSAWSKAKTIKTKK